METYKDLPASMLTVRDLLAVVAGALKARGHKTCLAFDGSDLYVGETSVACATRYGKLRIAAAQVFDGFKHVVPDDCDVSTLTPGSRAVSVERLVAAIEKRMAAREMSLPVPVDASAVVRDP